MQGSAVLSFLTFAVSTSPCAAQRLGTIEISPFVGSYVATAQLPPVGCVYVKDAAQSCEAYFRRQSIAVAAGGRLTAWLNPRVALEGAVWYSPSPITSRSSYYSPLKPTGIEATVREATAAIVVPSARVVVSPIRGPGRWAYVAAGPAWVSRFGAEHDGFSGMARLATVLGAGVHFNIARSLAIRGEVEEYFYSIPASGNDPTRYRQRDLLFSVGLAATARRME